MGRKKKITNAQVDAAFAKADKFCSRIELQYSEIQRLQDQIVICVNKITDLSSDEATARLKACDLADLFDEQENQEPEVCA